MDELESKLSSMIESLDELTKVLNKSKSNREDVSMTMLYKNIEDGILDKIHDANQHQLNIMMNSYRFKYYTEFNTDKELLRNEIQKRLRDNKLKELGL
jgi:RNase adaptor protein for sRNA GlmZ degradation